MAIVDAQIHIWRNNKPTNASHRQIADFTASDVLKEMDEAGVDAAVIHPPGWDPDSNALAVEAARQHRHHADAVLLEAVRHDVHRGAAVAERPRPRPRHGRRDRRLARLEASRDGVIVQTELAMC